MRQKKKEALHVGVFLYFHMGISIIAKVIGGHFRGWWLGAIVFKNWEIPTFMPNCDSFLVKTPMLIECLSFHCFLL